ncbi:hypothetical protein B0O99DRAFT_50680 [Bisporella sp. PMI_857]|nr:hypothetical protein B0O99DRAFT_50680 [Bisporella sp. PMI_857]
MSERPSGKFNATKHKRPPIITVVNTSPAKDSIVATDQNNKAQQLVNKNAKKDKRDSRAIRFTA